MLIVSLIRFGFEYSDQLTSKQLKCINLIIYFRGYFSHFKPYILLKGQIPCENRCGKLEDVNIFNFFFIRVQAGAAPAPTGINGTRLYGRFRVFRGDVCREIGCSKMLAICCIQSFERSTCIYYLFVICF
jgi:hypothetical protein